MSSARQRANCVVNVWTKIKNQGAPCSARAGSGPAVRRRREKLQEERKRKEERVSKAGPVKPLMGQEK
jgi:hypothetical protein